MFFAALIEDGIGVVDVDEDFAALRVAWELGEQAIAAGKWKVAHFTGSFMTAASLDQLVVRPESGVEECNIGGCCGFDPFAGALRKTRRKAKRFSGLFEAQCQDGFLRWQRAAKLRADKVGIVASERNRSADEGRGSRWVVAKPASEPGTRT